MYDPVFVDQRPLHRDRLFDPTGSVMARVEDHVRKRFNQISITGFNVIRGKGAMDMAKDLQEQLRSRRLSATVYVHYSSGSLALTSSGVQLKSGVNKKHPHYMPSSFSAALQVRVCCFP